MVLPQLSTEEVDGLEVPFTFKELEAAVTGAAPPESSGLFRPLLSSFIVPPFLSYSSLP
jgi:hypothetical protein